MAKRANPSTSAAARQKGEPRLPTEALEVRRAAGEPVDAQRLHHLFFRLENDLVAVPVPSPQFRVCRMCHSHETIILGRKVFSFWKCEGIALMLDLYFLKHEAC